MTGSDTLPGDPVARVRVALAERSYDILIGNGLRHRFAAEIAAALPRPRAIVVTDETVAGHYLAPLEAGLAAAGVSVDSIVLPLGEETKSFDHLERLTAQGRRSRPRPARSAYRAAPGRDEGIAR